MTEQEQIEQMAKKTSACDHDGRSCSKCWKCSSDECPAYLCAEDFFKLGYRKADEVRKETAGKIYNHIYDSIPVEEQFDFIRGIKFAMEIVEKYGVEVADEK